MNNGIISTVKHNIWKSVLSTATIVHPILNTKLLYFRNFKKFPNLNNPQTLNEKLLYLKLYDYNNNDLVVKCADKYKVRDFLKEHGCGEYLNELVGVYDTADEIQWDELPQKFVLKWNFGASYNIVCTDKGLLDIPETVKKLNYWGKKRYWLGTSEMQYKKCKKRIICERFLETGGDKLPEDYKLYCFNGKVRAILFITDRENKEKQGGFFTPTWDYIGVPSKWYKKFDILPNCPKSITNMIYVAEELSQQFPFVRVDFYESNGKAIFGEMTFTPGAGVVAAQIDIEGESMGDMLKLNL